MFVLDRIEGSRAIIMQKDRAIVIDASLLPENTREGDILNIIFADETPVCITVDEQATEQRRAKMRRKLNNLFGK